MRKDVSEKLKSIKVSVKSSQDIYKVVEPFLPNKKTSARKLLEDGMAEAKKMSEFVGSIRPPANIDFHGFVPAQPIEGVMNVDLLIKERMGGKRIGDVVEWVVSDGTFRFDIYTGKVVKVQ